MTCHWASDVEVATKLLVFSCGLHGLVHMADSIKKSLMEAEKALFDGLVPSVAPQMTKASESATVWLVALHAKLLLEEEMPKVDVTYSPWCMFSHFWGRTSSLPCLFAHSEGIGSVFFFQMLGICSLCISDDGGLSQLLWPIPPAHMCPTWLKNIRILGWPQNAPSSIEAHRDPLWPVIEDPSVHVFDKVEKYQQLVCFLREASLRTLWQANCYLLEKPQW